VSAAQGGSHNQAWCREPVFDATTHRGRRHRRRLRLAPATRVTVIMAETSAGLLTSATTPVASPPALVISSAVSLTPSAEGNQGPGNQRIKLEA